MAYKRSYHNRDVIFEFLRRKFNLEEIKTLTAIYFTAFHNEHGTLESTETIAKELLAYCEQKQLFDEMLQALEIFNGDAYKKYLKLFSHSLLPVEVALDVNDKTEPIIHQLENGNQEVAFSLVAQQFDIPQNLVLSVTLGQIVIIAFLPAHMIFLLNEGLDINGVTGTITGDYRELYSQGVNLMEVQLNGEDLSGVDFQRASLIGTNFQDAKLNDANIQRANLRGAYLARANMQRANLFGADSYAAEFVETDLSHAYLIGANMQRANMQKANLQQAYLIEANLIEARLQGADLRGANLQGADLRGAKLQGADLREAGLLGANLQDADLRGVKISQEDIEAADVGAIGQIGDTGESHINYGYTSGRHFPIPLWAVIVTIAVVIMIILAVLLL